jgi:hypothetical protein
MRDLPIIDSSVNTSFNFDNFRRMTKNVDLLSFRRKVREE